MSRFRKILFAVFLAIPLLFFVLILLLQTPFGEKRMLSFAERYAYDAYRVRFRGDSLDLRLLPLTARINGMCLYGGKKNDHLFLRAKYIQLQAPYSILWSSNTIVNTIQIASPSIDPQNLPQPELPNEHSKGTFQIHKVLVMGGSLHYSNFDFTDIVMNAQLEPNALRLTRLQAKLDQISLAADGVLETSGQTRITIRYRAAGKAESLSKYFPAIPPLAGQLETAGNAQGSGGNYVVEGSLQTTGLSVDGAAPLAADGTYKIDTSDKNAPYNARIKWRNLPLQQILHRVAPTVPPIAAVGFGSLEYHGGPDFLHGKGAFRMEVAPARLKGFAVSGNMQGKLGGGALHLEPGQIRFVSSRIDISGDLFSDTMNVKIHAEVPRPADLSSLYKDLRKVPGSYRIDSVISGPYKNLLANAHVSGQSEELTVQADLSYWMATHNLRLVLNGNADAAIVNRFYAAGVEGALHVKADVSGNIMHPAGTAEIQGDNLHVRDVDLDGAYARVNGDGRAMNLYAHIARYAVTVDGSYAFAKRRYQLNVHAKDLDIAQLAPLLPASAAGLSGNVTADLSASGDAVRWKNSDAQIVIQKASLSRDQLHADITSGTVQLAHQTATVAMRVQLAGGSLDINGTAPLSKTGKLMMHASGQANLSILSLFTNQVQAAGTINMDVNVSGSIGHPVFNGKAASSSFSLEVPARHIQLTQAALDAEFSGQNLALDSNALLNGSPLQVKGSLSFGGGPGEMAISLRSFPLATLNAATRLSGSVAVALQAHGTGVNPANWNGDLTVTPTKVAYGTTPLESEPVRVHMDVGKIELMPVHLRAADLVDATAKGIVNLRSGEIAGLLQGNTDLVLLSEFTDSIRAGGKVTANVQVGGNLAHPAFNGALQLNNGTIQLVDSPILLERVNLTIPLQQDKITISNFSANMGGGGITAGGTMQLKNWRPGPVDLWVKAQKIGMNYPAGLHSQISANLTLVSLMQDYLLGGKLTIDRSIYKEDIDPRERIVNTLLAEKTALSPDTSSRGRLRLDVEVDSIDDLSMRNNLGKVQAAAGLRITGNLLEPRVSGRVRVREGSKIAFQGNEFEVQHGIVDFYGRRKITPVLDVQLFTIATDSQTKEEYEITIPLSGPVDKLDNRDPESSPPLDPNQIYFLLLTGRVDAQLSRAGSRFFQQQLASYAAGKMFSDVQSKVAGAFGLQRVEIQPEVVSSETSPGAKLVLGKDFNSSLSLIYSTSLTQSREQTWIANYVVRRNLNVRFVDQEDGSYTANIRHLVRFGTGRTLRSLRRNIPRPRFETIKTIQIRNESPLTDDEIHGKLNINEADTYDYWKVQDMADAIKILLQDRGYLFPSVDVQSADTGNGALALTIAVSANKRSEMLFDGAVTKHQIDKYKTWWREGFSEDAVLRLINDDLQRGYWFQGYHKVAVTQKTEESGGLTTYRFQIVTGPKFQTVRIDFKGAVRYRANELDEDLRRLYPSREEMNAEAIHHFSSMAQKIAALYIKRGYLEAKATEGETTDEGGVRLGKEVVVDEGPQSRIADILIRGLDSFSPDLQEMLKQKAGGLYDPQALAEDEMTIQDYYESKGYRKFQIDSEVSKAGESKDLNIEYDVQPGGIAKIASIEVHGIQHTDESLIRKRLAFKVGDIVTHNKLAAAQKNLYDLRIFQQATVQAKETTTPNEYDVVVDLAEMRHYELTYGFRYDTQKGVGGEFQLGDLNLFGKGQGLSLYTRVNRFNQLFRTTYHSPTLSGLKWKTLVSGSYENGDLTLREGNDFSLAEGQRLLFTFQRQRPIRGPFLLLTSYEFESLRTRPRDATFLPFQRLDISRLVGTALEDTRDDPLNAKKGTLLSLDVQYSPTYLGSDVNYIKNFSQWFRFQRVGRMLWASGVRVGASTHLDPRLITERFLAGGSYTIRGFKQDQVGPKDVFGNPIGGEGLFIINEELRIPIYKWFGAAVFYDAGNVYNMMSDFNPLRLRHSFGFGLRFDSPFGIARIDLGINPSTHFGESRTVLHFGLGQAF